MSITPDVLETEFSLTTAATRLDFLSRRDNGDTALNSVRDDHEEFGARSGWRPPRSTSTRPSNCSPSARWWPARPISRLVGMRAALRCGASWEQIAAVLDVTPVKPQDAFRDSISRQLDDDAATAARPGRFPPQLIAGAASLAAFPR